MGCIGMFTHKNKYCIRLIYLCCDSSFDAADIPRLYFLRRTIIKTEIDISITSPHIEGVLILTIIVKIKAYKNLHIILFNVYHQHSVPAIFQAVTHICFKKKNYYRF